MIQNEIRLQKTTNKEIIGQNMNIKEIAEQNINIKEITEQNMNIKDVIGQNMNIKDVIGQNMNIKDVIGQNKNIKDVKNITMFDGTNTIRNIETTGRIMKSIFYNYVISNPVCRSLLLPVMTIMIVAKYLEVMGAEQTEKLTSMIQSGQMDLPVILKFSILSLTIVILVEIQAFIICKAGQLGYRIANKDAFRHFLDLDPDNFNKIGKGEIQNIVNRKSQAVQDMIDVFTLNFFPTFLTLIFVSYSVFNNLGWGTVILINFGVILFACITIKITEYRNNMRKRLNKAQNIASNSMMDSLYNYETIYTYNSQDIEEEKYDKILKDVEINSTELARSMYLLNLAQKGIWCVMTIAIVFKLCYVNTGFIKVEKFTFLLSIIGIVMKSMDNLGFMYGKFKTALINARIGFGVDTVRNSDGFRTGLKLKDEIQIKNLSIRRGLKNIITDLTFNIKKGDKIAIIGENGTGKSTILKALVKLNKYEGEISVDGIKLEDLTKSSLKNILTYVPQNPVLFDNTIMENVKYGNKKIFDEDVIDMSKKLGIHDSIVRLETGYNTKVGEQGKNLSGGERQKILILRTILRDSSVIVMDEPTSSLDKLAEEKLLTNILNIKDLTVISIVHNMETIKLFNRVLMLRDGVITENPGTDSEVIFE